MGGLMAILAFFAGQLAAEEKGLVSTASMSRYRSIRNLMFLAAGLFFVTVLPPFWTTEIEGTPIRFYFWILPLVVSRLQSSYEFRSQKKEIQRRR
jgi:hypothetical protein